jgi:hypothetical protein
VYLPGPGNTQINDINPGINPYPAGLFWTIPLPPQSVVANPGAGSAVYRATNIEIRDFVDFNESLSGQPGDPATVSFEVRWSGVDQRVRIHDEDTEFAGEFVRGKAQMRWAAVVGNYQFRSEPLSTSSSDFAEIGTMRNGTFFPHR